MIISLIWLLPHRLVLERHVDDEGVRRLAFLLARDRGFRGRGRFRRRRRNGGRAGRGEGRGRGGREAEPDDGGERGGPESRVQSQTGIHTTYNQEYCKRQRQNTYLLDAAADDDDATLAR